MRFALLNIIVLVMSILVSCRNENAIREKCYASYELVGAR